DVPATGDGTVWVPIARPVEPPVPHGLLRGGGGRAAEAPARPGAPAQPDACAEARPPPAAPAQSGLPAWLAQERAAGSAATPVPPPPTPWAPTETGASVSTWRPSDTQGPAPWGGFERLDTYIVALKRWSKRTWLPAEQGEKIWSRSKPGSERWTWKRMTSQSKPRVCVTADSDHEQEGEDTRGQDVYFEFEEDLVMDNEDAAAFYEAIADQELDEEQAIVVLAAVLDEKREEEGRLRKWAESRELKKAIARDRDFLDSKRAGGRQVPRPTAGKQRLSIARLEEKTRCANCGQEGHWRKECTNPYMPKSEVRGRGQKGTTGAEGSMYVAASGHGNGICALRTPESADRPYQETYPLEINGEEPGGMVDTAAGQALVGESQLRDREKGWSIPTRRTDGCSGAKGVGGRSKVVGEAMVPVTRAGVRCLILFRIVSEDAPLLLPVRWLENLGAIADLAMGALALRHD
ncbi:unnamed protein product, partial [Prorocentrum cordatum]